MSGPSLAAFSLCRGRLRAVAPTLGDRRYPKLEFHIRTFKDFTILHSLAPITTGLLVAHCSFFIRCHGNDPLKDPPHQRAIRIQSFSLFDALNRWKGMPAFVYKRPHTGSGGGQNMLSPRRWPNDEAQREP
ncbi:hypothetical protein CDAR_589451 [Caerostris darwini]|uniref:Uncharacterized protein n=1 Tax=Caerostris darwini TaxID=1538125 RepID=A0AAV4TBK1_9ARAC|nr:hypothetical protein CDAR_589451 [Caerostris darwini]